MSRTMTRTALATALAAAAFTWSSTGLAKPIYTNPLDPRFDYHRYITAEAPTVTSDDSAWRFAAHNPLHPSFDYHPQVAAASGATAAAPAAVETNPLHPRFNHANRGRATHDETAQREGDTLSLAATRRLLGSYEGAAYEYRTESNPLHPRYDFHPHVTQSAAAASALDISLSPLHPRYYAARSTFAGAAPATYTAVVIPLSPLDPRYSLRMQ